MISYKESLVRIFQRWKEEIHQVEVDNEERPELFPRRGLCFSGIKWRDSWEPLSSLESLDFSN